MNRGQLLDALTLITAVVDAARQFLFSKLSIAQFSPRLSPMLQRIGTTPVGGRYGVEHIVSCFIPNTVSLLVKQIFPPLLVAPAAVFVQRTDGTHDMKVRIGYTAILLVGSMNGEVHDHATAHKLF